MNGSSIVNHPTNEQTIGKFHVVNVDKLSTNSINNHDDTIAHIVQQIPSNNDESSCASRFQMIRVDRNFVRGRWKVNDYEPPENMSTSTIPPVNTIENEPILCSNTSILSNIPAFVGGDSNTTSSATFAAAAASAATAAAFQQQHQQRLPFNNTPTVMPTANIPPSTGLLHGYPPGALTNLATPNQSYLLQNHPQFSYYHFYPSPYSPYAASWAAALATSNPYLMPSSLAQSQTTSSLQPSNLNETVPDINGENTVMSSASFPNLTTDHMQNAQLAAAAAMPFLYAAHHSHSPFPPQSSAAVPSSYATIPSYHPAPLPPTILPPHQPPQSLPLFQTNSNNTIDIQQSNQLSTQQAPILTSPKHDVTKNLIQQSSLITTPKPQTTTTTNMTDLFSSTPSLINSQQVPATLISPITTTATSLNDIWTYTTSGTPLNLTQTAAQTAAVAAMGLLNNANNHNTEIENEIIKELTTPTKQNNLSLQERRAHLRLRRQLSTTDIDNKISAAMDLVKMHLLSAVREEVTELRQQIRTLNEKITNIEHENTFLRQHVSSEIYAQYIPTLVSLPSSNDSIATIIPSSLSSQSLPMTSLSSLPNSLAQQPFLSTANSQSVLSTINLPPT